MRQWKLEISATASRVNSHVATLSGPNKIDAKYRDALNSTSRHRATIHRRRPSSAQSTDRNFDVTFLFPGLSYPGDKILPAGQEAWRKVRREFIFLNSRRSRLRMERLYYCRCTLEAVPRVRSIFAATRRDFAVIYAYSSSAISNFHVDVFHTKAERDRERKNKRVRGKTNPSHILVEKI